MTLPTGNRASVRLWTRAGFTLIELVLVMAILIIVLAVSGPSLQSFFKGRTLDSEARRLLALTHYAQSRAVSEGVPILIWINSTEGRYGIEAEPGYLDQDPKAASYELGKDLTVELQGIAATSVLKSDSRIRFTPDGFISELHPEAIMLGQKNGDTVWITPSRNRLSYEISTNQFAKR